MSDNIVTRLREAIIADAVERREIVNGILAERLIRERHKAADEIECLTAERDALRAQLYEARAALKPLAMALSWAEEVDDATAEDRWSVANTTVAQIVTYGDLRRTRAVYEGIRGGRDE